MGRRKASSKSFNTASRKLNCPELVKPHLNQFENFVKIYAPSENQKYKINSFSICLSNICDCSNVDAAYLHFKENSTECFFWVESNQDENEKQVKISYANCEVPYEVLMSLSTPKQFDLLLDVETLQCTNLLVGVFINSSLIKTLSHPSEPYLNRYRSDVQTVVKYFCGISTEGNYFFPLEL
ncbi:e3 ubiquitin-protein ligase SHPRH [Trichonephila inaurata madagascariensis]|uniref:E3 ubiquitin-protein ligase SHPRH n=1 Tax=Trichonephila inaurata madagascariensis TaxID=2747483 RepID=A0A8X6YX00_9ARAC|nr:e3 ubiquitin-protein ligase SHPRH [Trichonephila inaurata madagascariensis]